MALAQKVIVSSLVACVLLSLIADAFIISKRAVSTEQDTEKSIECQKSTPCGWAVYKRFTRKIDYFMKNRCECPRGKKCVVSDDDISVTAYVYRCKVTDHPEDNGDGSSS